MSDDNPRKARHIVIKIALFFVVFAALYLTGFVVTVYETAVENQRPANQRTQENHE